MSVGAFLVMSPRARKAHLVYFFKRREESQTARNEPGLEVTFEVPLGVCCARHGGGRRRRRRGLRGSDTRRRGMVPREDPRPDG